MRITIPNSLGATVLTMLSPTVSGYMQLHSPPPFNASNNPHRTSPPDQSLKNITYDIFNTPEPLCRGYLSLLGKPQGAPTATWAAGSNQTWSLQVGDYSGSGSCIVGFLDPRQTTGFIHDGFKDFVEAMEYQGTCPHRYAGDGPDDQQFNLTVPEDLSLGLKVFVWIFYNLQNEFNMNCAAVNITKPRAGTGIEGGESQPDLRGSHPSSSGRTSTFRSSDTTSTTFTTLHKTSTIVTTTTVPSPQALSVESDTGGLAVTTTTTTLPPAQPLSSQTGFTLAPSPPSSFTATTSETALSTAQSLNSPSGTSDSNSGTATVTPPQKDSQPSGSGSPPAPSPPFAVNTPSGETDHLVTTTLPASTTTVTTTVERSDGNSITTTISGISVFSSLLTSPSPAPSMPDTLSSGLGVSASSSESVTAINITITVPTGSYSASASATNSQGLPSMNTVTPSATGFADSYSLSASASASQSLSSTNDEPGATGPACALSASASATHSGVWTKYPMSMLPSCLDTAITHINPSVPFSASSTLSTSLSGVEYTSTTMTVVQTITKYSSQYSTSGSVSVSASGSASAPTTSSASASVPSTVSTFAPNPTAAADNSGGTVHFNTTNGCSCACPAEDPTNIGGCNCYCNPPKECLDLMNSTSDFKLDPAGVKYEEKYNLPRPDDLVTHGRRSNLDTKEYSTTTTIVWNLNRASPISTSTY